MENQKERVGNTQLSNEGSPTIPVTDGGSKYITPNSPDLSESQKSQVKELFRPELQAEVRDTKKDFITIFGLFAALVTFLSVDVQIFKTTNNINQLIGLTLLSTALILLFTIIINGIVKDRTNWKDILSPIYMFVLIFLIVGTTLLTCSHSQNSNKAEETSVNSKDSTKIKLQYNVTVIDTAPQENQSKNAIIKIRSDSVKLFKKQK